LNKTKLVSVLSRGYGRKSSGYYRVSTQSDFLKVGDEPLQIASKFPEINVAVSEKRTLGIKELLKVKSDVIILDDAFQHRWVKPGLSILLTKYNDLFINDSLLPLGRLREPKSCYLRADVIVVTDTPNPLLPLDEYRLIEQLSPAFHQKICFSYFKYLTPKALFSNDLPENIFKKDIVLVTGIAKSLSLLDYIENNNGKIRSHLKYKDHYKYKSNDVKKIIQVFNSISSTEKLILTTEKDAVRLKKFEKLFANVNIFYIPIEVKFHGKTNFNSLLLTYVEENNFNS